MFFKVASTVSFCSLSLVNERNFARTRMDGFECGWYLRGVYFATAFVLGEFLVGEGGDFFPSLLSLSLRVEKKNRFFERRRGRDAKIETDG